MMVRVRYTGPLRAISGVSEETVELPSGARLAELLHCLARNNQEAAPHLVAESGDLRSSLLVVVEGHAISAREAAARTLFEGNLVELLPPIAGG